MSIKILQLVTQRQYRGAEVFAATLSNELLKKGYSIIFAGLYRDNSRSLAVKGAKNIDLGEKSYFLNIFVIWKLIALIRREKPDIIQANGSDTLKYAVIAQFFLSKTPLIYRNISMISAWSKKGGIRHRFYKWLFRRVDFVTSVGEESINDFIRTYSFPVEKSKVINRGVPNLIFDKNIEKEKLAAEFNFLPTDLLMIHVGQFSAEKNHRFLIDAFEKLIGQNNNIHLILVGEGKLLPEIKQLSVTKGLSGKVHFAGYRDPVQKLLAAADIFLLTSLIEGVPGVIIEAGMQKLPTISINVGGVKEVLIDNKTGILLGTHDLNGFCQKTESLITDKESRVRLGNAAYDFVMKNYTIENCVNNFESLYLYLINKK